MISFVAMAVALVAFSIPASSVRPSELATARNLQQPQNARTLASSSQQDRQAAGGDQDDSGSLQFEGECVGEVLLNEAQGTRQRAVNLILHAPSSSWWICSWG